MDFTTLRDKYKNFIYDSYSIEWEDDYCTFTFHFIIEDLVTFNPTIKMKKTNNNIDMNILNNLVFHIGLIELISYYKCCCPKNIIIKAGYLDNDQINWFKKLYYYGLGEFMYVNNINCSMDDLMNITCVNNSNIDMTNNYNGQGNMIAIGGGKDSCVTINLLKGLDNTCFMINPKQPGIDTIKEAGYEDYINIERKIDSKLLELNKQGYLNGHTPFSSLVAFVSYASAYLNNKKYIVLSNESSANEPTVIGTKINHQYSKTYEFENDFNSYTTKYLKLNIKYFSLLRCLSEFQIGMLFSQYKNYHKIFKSCNVGSKTIPWTWCTDCPKCLFVYIILRPFLSKEEMIDIFGNDMLDNKDLLNTFIELIGYSETKPFECVGTYSEVRYACSLVINKEDNLPYLLQYYKDNYPLELNRDYIHEFNNENNIPDEFISIVKKELERVCEVIDND